MDLEAKAQEYSNRLGYTVTADQIQRDWDSMFEGAIQTLTTESILEQLSDQTITAPNYLDDQEGWRTDLNDLIYTLDGIKYNMEKGTIPSTVDLDKVLPAMDEAIQNLQSFSSNETVEEGMSTSNSPLADPQADLNSFSNPSDYYADTWSSENAFDELNAMLSFFDPAERTTSSSFKATSAFVDEEDPLGTPQAFTPADVKAIIDEVMNGTAFQAPTGFLGPTNIPNTGLLDENAFNEQNSRNPLNIDPAVFDRMGEAISEVVGRDPYDAKDSAFSNPLGNISASDGYGQGTYMSRSDYGRNYDYSDGYSGKGGFDSPSESARGGEASSGYAYGDRGGNEGAYSSSKDSGLGGSSGSGFGSNETSYDSKDSGQGGTSATSSTSSSKGSNETSYDSKDSGQGGTASTSNSTGVSGYTSDGYENTSSFGGMR